MSALETKLLSIGLSEKEVSVYLSMLNLGAATAQDIAIRADVNRATTYVMIDSLRDKGIVSEITKDKKTFYQAEDPIQILKVLEDRKTDLDEKMGQARLVIPHLQELYNLNRSKVNVRLLEGRESVRIIQNEIARSKKKSFDNIVNWSLANEKFPVSEKDHRKPFYDQNFKVRTIFTFDTGKPMTHLPFLKNEERRMIPHDKFPIQGEVVMYDNKIAMINLKDRIFGIIIEDDQLFQTYKAIFDLAWEASEKYKLK